MALTKLNTLSLADDAITSAKIADDAITSALIADDAVVAAAIADDAVVAAAIADNAVVTAAIADNAVTSAKSTVTGANPNLIINGDMAIAQRASSSTATGVKVVDRWGSLWGGSGSAITQSQVALTSGGAYDEGHRHAFKMAVTSTSSANDRYAQMRYIPEAKDIRNMGWQYTSGSSYITISWWAKVSLAGTYWFTFYGPDSGTAQQYITSYALAANTWTKVTKTIPGGSNIVLNDDNGIGFYIDWRLDKGTDDTASDATLNAWTNYVAGKTGTDYAQAWQNTANATFELTGVKLEVGQTATTFEKPDYTTEIQKCQRYFWCIKASDGTYYAFLLQFAANTISGWNPYWYLGFPVKMRANPTLSLEGTLAVNNTNTAAGASYPQGIISTYKNTQSCAIGIYQTSYGAPSYIHTNSTDDMIMFDAEL